MRFQQQLQVCTLTAGLLVGLSVQTLQAAPAADTIFPADTVAFVSVSNPTDLSQRFRRTLIGQLVNDESMQDFAHHLRDEVVNQVGDVENRLGVTLDELFDAAGGELAIAVVGHRNRQPCLAMTLNISGKQAEADNAVAQIEQKLIEQGAKKSTSEQAGVSLTRYDLPAREAVAGKPKRDARSVVYFQSGDLLVAVDRMEDVAGLVAAVAGGASEPLRETASYQKVMQRCQQEPAGEQADIRWFVDPFAFDKARATMRMPDLLAEGKDLMTILGENGFQAIKAIGGHIGFSLDNERDIQHCSYIYAPGNPAAGVSPAKRFGGSMRIADIPNRPDMDVERWTPRDIATYNTFNLNIQGVFDNLAPLFDAIAGWQNAFENTLTGFKDDPFGPKIDIRQEIIANLGSRVSMMTNYTLPVTPECQRYLFVLEVANPAALRTPIDKLMKSDRAESRLLQGIQYWEVIPESEEPVDVGGLPDFDDSLFEDPLQDDSAQQEAADTQNAAVCLHEGNLIVASDVEFLKQALFGVEPRESLAGSEDFQFAMAQLGRLAPWERCAWSFSRNDETLRASYELTRLGKMPESRTFFGQLLNQALTTEEDEEKGIVRKQRLDGGKVPSFEIARRYFGPSIRAAHTDNEGWLVVGVLLNKTGQ